MMAGRSSRVVAATVLFVAIAAPLPGAAAGLTLADAVRYALAHSPTVAKQVAAVSQQTAAYVRQRSQELPGLTGSLQNQMQKSNNFSGAYSVIGLSQAQVFSQNTASLGTTYTFNGGLSHYQTLLAKQQLDQTQSDLRKLQQQIATDVTGAFYTLAGKRETVRLDQGDEGYERVLVDVAKAKVRAGVSAGVDVLSANAAEEKSRYTLDAAQADAENSRENLAQIIGAPLDAQFNVPAQISQPPLPAQPLDKLIAIAQANRPEVATAAMGVQIARINRRSADTDLYPQIQTFASLGNQFSPTLAVSEQQQFNDFNAAHGLPLQPIVRGNPGFWQIGVNSSISLPFVDWGARSANHRNLNEQITEANTNLTAMQTQVELDVRQAYRGAQTALAQLASAQDETRYSVEAARIAKLQYENGLKSLIDVLQAQQAALSAQTDLFNARTAYVNAIVKLRVSLGIYGPQQAVSDLGNQ